MTSKLLPAVAALALWGALSGAAQAAVDLTGTWALDQPPEWKAAAQRGAEMTDAAKAETAADRKFMADNHFIMGEGHVKCWPPGMPGAMTSPYGMHFMQNKERLAIMPEVSTVNRMVYLTQKTHDMDAIQPSWNGHSIGHFEGDVLVIDTVGFNGRAGRVGVKGHIVERAFLTDKGQHLVIETTLDDTDMYVKPFTFKTRYARQTGQAADMIEYGCEVIEKKLEDYNAALRKIGKEPYEPQVFD